MTATAKSVRVRGVTYRNPDEAYVAAEEIEHRADELAAELRRSGKDGEADQLQDRGHADAERLRSWAREQQAAEAARTDQPADRPSASGRRKPRRRGGRNSSTSSRPRLTPQARSIVADTGIPRTTSTVTGLLVQLAGLTLGVALLTLLLTRRGVQAFSDLAGGAARGLDWIIAPTDPLAPRPKVGVQGASRAATAYARSGAAHATPVAARSAW